LHCRILPPWEIEEVSNFLQHTLLCNVDMLPTESLVHQYQTLFPAQYHSMLHFVECVFSKVPNRCPNTLEKRTFCGKRFGVQTDERREECRKLMLNAGDRQVNTSMEIRKDLLQNFKCMREVRQTVDRSCKHLLLGACKPRSMRAVKVNLLYLF